MFIMHVLDPKTSKRDIIVSTILRRRKNGPHLLLSILKFRDACIPVLFAQICLQRQVSFSVVNHSNNFRHMAHDIINMIQVEML